MASRKIEALLFVAVLVCVVALPATAQSFRVQCPTSTITHPAALNNNNAEPAYTGATVLSTATPTTFQKPTANVNGAIKCQQISGGDGYATMGDGTQTYMFSFGPLSGLTDIANGLPGTQFPSVFNTLYNTTGPTAATHLQPGDPATTVDGNGTFSFNGAVGLALDIAHLVTIYDIQEVTAPGTTVVVQLNAPSELNVGDTVKIAGTGGLPPAGYDGTYNVVLSLIHI